MRDFFICGHSIVLSVLESHGCPWLFSRTELALFAGPSCPWRPGTLFVSGLGLAVGKGMGRQAPYCSELGEWGLREQGNWSSFLFPICFQGKGGGQAGRPFVDHFGFDVVTCCGYLPQVSDTSILTLLLNRVSC